MVVSSHLLVDHNCEENILVYAGKYRDIQPFLNLKDKIYIFLKKDQPTCLTLKNNQIKIKNRKSLFKMFFLDILIVNGIKKNLNNTIIEILGNISRIKKVILFDNDNDKKKIEMRKSKEFFNQLELKIFLKKKLLMSRNKTKFFNKKNDIFTIIRRKRLPIICLSKIKSITKLFFYKFNKRFGSLINNKKFYLSMNIVEAFNKSKFSKNLYSKSDFQENFQRVSEELGLLGSKPKLLKIKDFLYILSY